MKNPGLHPMTALELDPLAFIALAAENRCDTVSLFVNNPNPAATFPLVEPEQVAAVKRSLAENGVAVAGIETYFIAPGVDAAHFRPSLELGAELGARRLTTILYDTDPQRVADTLAATCELAREHGLQVAIEFMALTPAWNTLASVVDLVRRVDQPNLGIGVDGLHLVRSGGTTAEVAALAPALISYAQLCDGRGLQSSRDYVTEAASHRLVPGEGDFPLLDFLRALPSPVPVELEVPQPASVPAAERVRRIVDAGRRLLAQTDS